MKKIVFAVALAMTSASFAEEAVIVEEEAAPAYADSFSGLYLGLGIGGSFVKYEYGKYSEKCNRFIGTLVLGGGKAINQKFYVGGEFLMDFTKAKDKTFTDGANSITIKYQGVTPQLALRLGYANPYWGALFYGKAGVAFNKGKAWGVHNGENFSHSKTKAGFVLGLGAEKAFCKKFSARLEGDYNFGSNDHGMKFNKGFTIRALATYDINF